MPLLTWNMVITRIRNIAEHAVVPDSSDPLRNTRTTRANLKRPMAVVFIVGAARPLWQLRKGASL